MSLYRLAWYNARKNLKNYLSLVLSLAFTIMIFMNFQNLIYSKLFAAVGEYNKDYSDMVIQILSVVLGLFVIFFTGYAADVFLTRRKKEIGIYLFMGLTNEKIGRLYMLEMTAIGMITLAAGIGFGILTTQLFQMIVLALSDITVEIGFQLSYEPVLLTALFFGAVYLFFVGAGYFRIVRSSVINLISAGKRKESVRQGRALVLLKTVTGVCLLSAGFYAAVKEGGQEVLEHLALAVVLVVGGIYFLFGGLIPALFQGLAARKRFLYKKERDLWVNQVIFRMKKNYRTYAAVCVLMLCSVTALAAGFALNSRYEGMVHFRNTYTYQLLSVRPDLEAEAARLIGQENEISYQTKIPVLALKEPDGAESRSAQTGGKQCMFTAYTPLKQLAEAAGLAFDLKEPGRGETIELEHLMVLSLFTKREDVEVTVNGRKFLQTAAVNEPYLGYLQENLSFYVVNDQEYESMKKSGQEMYAYNYRIQDIENYKASLKALDQLVSRTGKDYTARIVTGPDSGGDREWIKILYSLCIFVVLVFIAAGGSILFMKLYNDAFEERERCGVLQKLGVSYQTIKRAVSRELFAAYGLPFAVMAVSSYFSVHAMEKLMFEDLTAVRLVSLAVIFVFFFCCYRLSIGIYLKNAGVRRTAA